MTTRSSIIRSVQGTMIRQKLWAERAEPVDNVRRLIEALRVVPSPRPLVRIGSEIDGGYLVPDDLDDIGACISPGVSTEVSFDLALAERGIPIHMADASVTAPPIDHPNFHFSRKFLDTYNSHNTVTLDDFIQDISPNKDLVLEMDIEGAEWRVLNSLSYRSLRRFRIMAIEFHDLINMFSRFGYREIRGVFDKLLATHAVVHIHPNNVTDPISVDGLSVPFLMEFTFYRRDRGQFTSGLLTFPNALDAPCCPEKVDYPLPACWQHGR